MTRIRRGVFKPLEEEANRLIKESLAGVTKHSDKADILTPWKEAARYKREVYVNEGTPDEAFRKGIYHRVVNQRRPDLNSKEGQARNAHVMRRSSLPTFMETGQEDDDS